MPITVREVLNILPAPPGLTTENGGAIVAIAHIRAGDPNVSAPSDIRIIGLTAGETNVNLIGLDLGDGYTFGWD